MFANTKIKSFIDRKLLSSAYCICKHTLWSAGLGDSNQQLLFMHLIDNKALQTATATSHLFSHAHTPKRSAHMDSGKQASGISSYLARQASVLRIWYSLVEQADQLTALRLSSHRSV